MPVNSEAARRSHEYGGPDQWRYEDVSVPAVPSSLPCRHHRKRRPVHGVDCQVYSDHLACFGAVLWRRERCRRALAKA